MSGVPENSKAEIIPFGKYKGQPVEVLLADEGYRDWLMSQDWFRARFGNIYQTIINYGAEPQDTPEHNEMQAAFLDDARCFRLARMLYPNSPFDRQAISRDRKWGAHGAALWQRFSEHIDAQHEDASIVSRQFEAGGWDVTYGVSSASLWLEVISLPPCSCDECDHEGDCPGSSPCHGGSSEQDHLCRHRRHAERAMPTKDTGYWPWSKSETHCDDTCPWSDERTAHWLLRDDDKDAFDHWFQSSMPGVIRVECKPDLGDDFPTVLRQVTRYEREHGDRCCVVVRRASFERVAWEQVAAMFAASKVTLLREAQLLAEGPGG